MVCAGGGNFMVRGPFQKFVGPFGLHFLTNKNSKSDFHMENN